MSGKYTKTGSIKKLPMIIGLAAIIVVMVLGLVACQISGNADSTEPTMERITETTRAATTGATEPSEKTTTATTEAATEPTTEEAEPTEHEHEYTEKVTSATCNADGYTTFTCDCGDSYKGSYVSAPGHSYGEWKTIKEPTKTAMGTAQRKCSKCGAAETKDLPKTVSGHPHQYAEKVTTAATCTKTGVKTFTCSCGDSYTESIAKTAHNLSSAKTSATCTANGYTTYTCKVCGYSYKDSYVTAKGHGWGSWVTTKAATESTTGTAVKTCGTCGATESKTLPKLAHTHNYTSKVTTAATCGRDGVKTYTCGCGDSYTEKIAKTGNHSYGNWVTTQEPTTSSTGTAVRTCSVCGATESKTLPKKEAPAVHTHEWGSWVTTKEPTTTATGTAERSCMSFGCGVTETKSLPKKEAPATHTHSWGEWVVIAPTCQTDGYKYHSCGCGAEETAPGSPATGHSYSVVSEVPATCSANGSRTYRCSCGDSYSETTTASHNWVHTAEQGHKVWSFACHCGGWSGTDLGSYEAHAQSSGDFGSHSYYEVVNWVVDVPASDKCSTCGATK